MTDPTRPARPTLDDLLERLHAGDTQALAVLLERNQARLEAQAKRHMGPHLRGRVRPSDILQSTYLRVLNSLPGFQGTTDEEFSHWVGRILQHTVATRLRYHSAAKRELDREQPVDVAELDPEDPRHHPSTAASYSEELLRIARAMQALPKDYVRILTLHMDPDQTHERTAALLGRSEGACRVLLARARAALMVRLQRGEGE